jgi:hypothetical protein
MGHRNLLFAIAVGLPGISAMGGAWVGAGWIWDGANAVGFVAAALVIYLHIDTGSARGRPALQAAFHSRLHANVAALALALVALHVGVLFADDPVTVEYWKASAPPYMLAGIGAVVLMSTIVATGYPTPRRALFASTAQFRRVHGIAGVLLTGLIAWHVAGSALYLDTRFKQTLFVIALVGLPLLMIRRAVLPRPVTAAPRLEPAQTRRETQYLATAAVSIAVVFAVLRNVFTGGW